MFTRLFPCLILIWFIFLLPAAAVAGSNAPSLPNVKAKAWVLLDHHSKGLLAEYNAKKRLPPASLTKMMVAYVVFTRLRTKELMLNDSVTISPRVSAARGARIFIRPNNFIKAEDLIKGMIIKSANDAAIALAEHVSSSEKDFVKLMNQQAHELGLTNTNFTNVTGAADSEHYSTAYDMGMLVSALIRDFPEYYQWFAEKEFKYSQIEYYNLNALLWRDPSVDGVKTGYNRAAGYCFAAAALRDDMRLINVVMGANTNQQRFQASQSLLDFGFKYYETRLLYQANVPTIKVPVWMGNTSMLPLGLEQNLYITIPRGSFEKLSAEVAVKDIQYAPIHLGQHIGTLSVMFDKKLVRQHPLVALREVGFGNLYQRTVDRIKLWLK